MNCARYALYCIRRAQYVSTRSSLGRSISAHPSSSKGCETGQTRNTALASLTGADHTNVSKRYQYVWRNNVSRKKYLPSYCVRVLASAPFGHPEWEVAVRSVL